MCTKVLESVGKIGPQRDCNKHPLGRRIDAVRPCVRSYRLYNDSFISELLVARRKNRCREPAQQAQGYPACERSGDQESCTHGFSSSYCVIASHPAHCHSAELKMVVQHSNSAELSCVILSSLVPEVTRCCRSFTT